MTVIAAAHSARACMHLAFSRWRAVAERQHQLTVVSKQLGSHAACRMARSAILAWADGTMARRHVRRCTAAAVAFYHAHTAPGVCAQ